jgi:hypothetical protein
MKKIKYSLMLCLKVWNWSTLVSASTALWMVVAGTTLCHIFPSIPHFGRSPLNALAGMLSENDQVEDIRNEEDEDLFPDTYDRVI